MAKQGGKSADSKPRKEETTGGGRSEQQAQQRDDDQAQIGHDESAKVPRGAVRNVKSEPHWDPADAPAERGAKGGNPPA